MNASSPRVDTATAPTATVPRVVGLTGGVASGKSTVAARIRARGLFVVDADRLARQVVEVGTPGLAAVVEAFGDNVLDSSGRLDRAKLGAMVFADEPSRQCLMAILHPRIATAAAARVQALGEQGQRLVIYDAALLVENGLADAFRPLIVVACERERQLERLMNRNGLNLAEAEERLRSQADLATKVALADHVIQNDGSIEELWAATDLVLGSIVSELGLAPETLAAPLARGQNRLPRGES